MPPRDPSGKLAMMVPMEKDITTNKAMAMNPTMEIKMAHLEASSRCCLACSLICIRGCFIESKVT